jgi:hypothetical protein
MLVVGHAVLLAYTSEEPNIEEGKVMRLSTTWLALLIDCGHFGGVTKVINIKIYSEKKTVLSSQDHQCFFVFHPVASIGCCQTRQCEKILD